MADPITIGVVSLIGIGSAIGGYLASPRKKECSLHRGVTERLAAGDKKFEKILDILSEHGDILARLDERTEHLKAR